MSTQIISFDITPILIQAGYGVPNHLSSLGTEYTDLYTGVKYINKDGILNWVQMLDITYPFSGGSGTFTGGTVTGPTYFLDGITANTISATTYYNLPLDINVTGSTLNPENYDFTLTRNDGVTITSNLGLLASDMNVTGGTYNINTGIVTFTNNSGGTFTVSGFTSGMTDTYTTGGTYYNGITTFTKTNGGTYTVSGYTTPFTGGTINGLTANIISATTYQNLPLDITVTGGTFSAGTTTFTNNTGGTFSITGQSKNLILYSEYTGNTTYPSPTATGVRSFAIGDGAKAISTDAISIGTAANLAAGSNNNSLIAIGTFASYNTSNSTLSTFIGNNAGLGSNGSINSIMLGANAGNGNSYGNAGSYTVTAPYSIYIGNNVGRVNTTNFYGSNNIVIGNTVGVASGTTNTLNIGGVIWANGLYSTTTGNTSTSAQTIGRVGINVVNPSETLHVNGTTLLSAGTQNILKVIGSGNSSSLPIFTVQGSQGELFSVSDSLTGSLFSVNDISGLPVLEAFSDNTVLMGSYLAPSLNTTVKIVATTGSTNIYSIPTSAYTGAFFDYTINDGTNLRAGNIMSIWSGTTIQYTETSTNDIGNTSGLTFNMIISGSSAILKTSGTTGTWTVKSIVRSI